MTAPAGTRIVLLIDPDPRLRGREARILAEAGYEITAVPALDDALRELASRPFDAIVTNLAGLSPSPSRGLKGIRREAPLAPLLLICDPSRVQSAIGLLRQGVEDYLLSPPDAFELRTRLDRVLERHDLNSRVAFFQQEFSKKSGLTPVDARSPAMRQVLERVLRVAPMRSTVLIQGESGVGKELVARSVHFNSPRRDQAFIALNCAAIPGSLIESELFGHERGAFTGAHARVRGKFEMAHRGTLFLDEIGEMDPATQVKLLRVLEEREIMRIGGDRNIRVDARVIAATNADLEALVADSRFRQDLYYRLKVVTIRIPPLRERRSDIPALARTFVEQLARVNAIGPKTLSADAIEALERHHWPGNVRELKNLIESTLVSSRSDVIEASDLSPAIGGERPNTSPAELAPGTKLAEMERELIRITLEHTGGNRTHSADLLGIGVRTLQRKIREYGLTIAPRRRRPRRAVR